jgi:hypothetical protein
MDLIGIFNELYSNLFIFKRNLKHFMEIKQI